MPIPLSEIKAAQKRIEGTAVRTPLVKLNVEDALAGIYLKLENLQPIGSFKIRGALNAMRLVDPEQLQQGVWTASSGNMAQGVAWGARELGVKCTVVVIDSTPETKLKAIESLGAEIVILPRDEWFKKVVFNEPFDQMEGLYIHPASDKNVIAGQGTIGLEILEDLPDVDAVITPFGGGGLTCGVASAIRSLKPDTRLYACELENGAPLAASLEAGKPVTIEPTPSPAFALGFSGAPTVIPEMWDLVSPLVDGSLTMSVEDLAFGIRLLADKNHVIAEGAGAAPVAVAMQGKAGGGKVVCVVSGGHIDADALSQILMGQVPEE